MRFRDRTEAGEQLARDLSVYANRPDLVVLGLPRGGVPVAFEAAKALNAPLDVFIVRKLGVPNQEELAMGAIATGGVQVINQEVVDALQITKAEIERVVLKEQQELARREKLYRGNRSPIDVRSRTVIIIDDGLATGYTMRAAVSALRQQYPAEIIVAVPIAAPETCHQLRGELEVVVCTVTPQPFYAVGLWYENFSQTTDEEVCSLLEKATEQQLIISSR